MRINREAFLRCLESVQPGLAATGKELIEQSASFAFRGGEVFSYNDEVSCRIDSPLDFEGAVKGTKLLELLRKLKEDEVEVETAADKLTVRGKGRKGVFALEREVVLPVDQMEKPKRWHPLPADFAEAVGIAGQCTGKDETDYRVACVHLHPKWIEGSDRLQICRWRIKTGLSKPLTIRYASIRHVVSAGMSEFAEAEPWLHFRNAAGLVLSCRYNVEDYFELGEYLKSDGEPVTLPKGLAEAADKALVFSSENADDNNVLVTLAPGKVRIKGQGLSGYYAEAKKIKYSGRPLQFLISPVLLADIVARHNEALISPDKLFIDAGLYKYVAALTVPSANGQEDERGESEAEE